MKKIISFSILVMASMHWAVYAAEDIIDDKVIIKGEKQKRVEAQKTPLTHEFNIDEVLTFDMEPVQDIYYFKSSKVDEDEFIKIPGYKPVSPLAGIRVTDIIIGSDIKIFKPAMLHKAKTWRLTILDSRGKAVREYTSFSKGMEDEIVWDGKDTAGSMLQVGYPYSTMFEWSNLKSVYDQQAKRIVWQDENQQKQTEIGTSFTIDALFYDDDNSKKIEITHAVLFPKKEVQTKQGFNGNEDIFNQAAVLVKEHYAAPITINVFDADKDGASRKAKELKMLMARKLIISRDNINAIGYKSQDNRLRTEIILGKLD
ncbi:MAG: hypothetical protein ABII23_05830 [bacterium]